jgi:glycosyltransferase involved in cell wall biosynthesis
MGVCNIRQVSRIVVVVYEDYARDSRVRRHSRALAARGHQVAVLALDSADGVACATRDGVTLRPLGRSKYRGGNRLRYVAAYLSFALRVTIALTRNHVDTIIVNNPPDFLVFATVFARVSGTKVALDVHDMTSDLYEAKFRAAGGRRVILPMVRAIETASYRFADVILTVHESYAARIRRRVSGKRVIPVLNIPDNIAPERRRVGARTALGSVRLGHHGTIVERFGIDLAVRAVGLARSEGLDVTLDILGDGDFAPEVQKLI